MPPKKTLTNYKINGEGESQHASMFVQFASIRQFSLIRERRKEVEERRKEVESPIKYILDNIFLTTSFMSLSHGQAHNCDSLWTDDAKNTMKMDFLENFASYLIRDEQIFFSIFSTQQNPIDIEINFKP